jgi:hypothetical protein
MEKDKKLRKKWKPWACELTGNNLDIIYTPLLGVKPTPPKGDTTSNLGSSRASSRLYLTDSLPIW